MTTIAPYGSWKSRITLDRLVEQVVGLGFPSDSGGDVYWVELRPAEGGRQVLVRARPTGEVEDVFGPEYHSRTLVHEYGGLPYGVYRDTVYFSNFADQRLYRVTPGEEPEPITPDPPSARSIRYAAPVLTPDGAYLYAVRERHASPDDPAAVENDLVVIATDGLSEPRVVADGHDFFGTPALSPDGRRLAWASWDHPNMPWDGTELWEAEIGADHLPAARRLVAGGSAESVIQPTYSPDGVLHFISDRTGWWNLYADGGSDGPEAGVPLARMEADLGVPDWVFGRSSYALCNDGSIVATWSQGGLARLGILRPGAGVFEEVRAGFDEVDFMQASGGSVLALAGSAAAPLAVVRITPGPIAGEPLVEVLKRSRENVEDPAYLSVPRPIEFPTEGGLSAHALYYPPTNPDFAAPEGELPPLIARGHGGPTSAAQAVLNYAIQFWTSRGIGVVDVNYGGSTGFGRAYRERLRGQWGVVDVDDCVNAVRYLAQSSLADPARLVIHGGSAGGYTTLCAVTFRDVFVTGASYFGVADAGALARDTHKFESRYCDGLIGPWPAAEAIYRERSPLFHTDHLTTPLILFQGLEDKVVPPSQAEEMAEALREKGLPFAYVAYEGEGHGFRRAENIRRTSEAELYFYGRVLGFAPADRLEPVEIENASALAG
jgi:dipeptidyl aminopeptidase/acylaminoacyl peptidase